MQYAKPQVKVKPTEVVTEQVVPQVDEEEAHAKEEKAKEKARVAEGLKRYQDIYDLLPFPGQMK